VKIKPIITNGEKAPQKYTPPLPPLPKTVWCIGWASRPAWAFVLVLCLVRHGIEEGGRGPPGCVALLFFAVRNDDGENYC